MSDAERSSPAPLSIDRREFIAAAGAVAAVAALPLAASTRAPERSAAAAAANAAAAAPLADWTIDDMWGVNPRYAEPIAYGRPHAARDLQAMAEPADLPFLA